MISKVKVIAGAAILAFMGSVSQAQGYDPNLTGYSYVYYADAAKTIPLGEVSDRGCGGWGEHRFVLRAYVPSPYYDTTEIFYCGGGGMEPPWW